MGVHTVLKTGASICLWKPGETFLVRAALTAVVYMFGVHSVPPGNTLALKVAPELCTLRTEVTSGEKHLLGVLVGTAL